MLYEEMRLKPSGNTVRVYSVSQDGTALVFDSERYIKNNNGWEKVKASRLVPLDYPLNSEDYCSKTKKNRAKSRLHLEDATWKGTDGTIWSHSQIEEAIAHELELMEKEKENEYEETFSGC